MIFRRIVYVLILLSALMAQLFDVGYLVHFLFFLILLLPVVTGANSIWFAMPFTELLVAIYVVCMIARYTKQLSTERKESYE